MSAEAQMICFKERQATYYSDPDYRLSICHTRLVGAARYQLVASCGTAASFDSFVWQDWKDASVFTPPLVKTSKKQLLPASCVRYFGKVANVLICALFTYSFIEKKILHNRSVIFITKQDMKSHIEGPDRAAPFYSQFRRKFYCSGLTFNELRVRVNSILEPALLTLCYYEYLYRFEDDKSSLMTG